MYCKVIHQYSNSSDFSPPLKSSSESLYPEALLVKTNVIKVVQCPSNIKVQSSFIDPGQSEGMDSFTVPLLPGEVRAGVVSVGRMFGEDESDHLLCSDVQVVVSQILPGKSKPDLGMGKSAFSFSGLLSMRSDSNPDVSPTARCYRPISRTTHLVPSPPSITDEFCLELQYSSQPQRVSLDIEVVTWVDRTSSKLVELLKELETNDSDSFETVTVAIEELTGLSRSDLSQVVISPMYSRKRSVVLELVPSVGLCIKAMGITEPSVPSEVSQSLPTGDTIRSLNHSFVTMQVDR